MTIPLTGADDETVNWDDSFGILTTFAPDPRVLRVPRRLAAGGAAAARTVRRHPGFDHS